MTLQEYFKNDPFANMIGMQLLEAGHGHAKATLHLKPEHQNAAGRTEGGVLFSLADFTLAAAANSHGILSLSLSANITFLKGSGTGDTLFAEAHERHLGRTTGCYQIDVTNQHGELIATFESTVFRLGTPVPFTP